jgi:hypothetical protein
LGGPFPISNRPTLLPRFGDSRLGQATLRLSPHRFFGPVPAFLEPVPPEGRSHLTCLNPWAKSFSPCRAKNADAQEVRRGRLTSQSADLSPYGDLSPNGLLSPNGAHMVTCPQSQMGSTNGDLSPKWGSLNRARHQASTVTDSVDFGRLGTFKIDVKCPDRCALIRCKLNAT